MKLDTRLDRRRLADHLHYNAWKYILIAVLSIFMWDLIYAFTAYRPPQDKRIDLYIQSASTSQEACDAYFGAIASSAAPDVELVSTALLMGTAQNDMYAAQQLTTYLMANEGDLYFLTGADFKRFAAQGVFLELEGFTLDGTLDTQGIDLKSGYVAMQAFDEARDTMVPVSQQRLYGIPAASLFGFMNDLGIDNRDLYLCVTIFNQNEENVLRFLDALIQSVRAPQAAAPAGLGILP
ncbi:MAG: hypothetical protein AB9880_03920 [Christensenellales bacterium]